MRQAYPPAEYIAARFADTTRIAVRRIAVSLTGPRTANVVVDIVEFRNVAPTEREFSGVWTLVKVNGRWYMDAASF